MSEKHGYRSLGSIIYDPEAPADVSPSEKIEDQKLAGDEESPLEGLPESRAIFLRVYGSEYSSALRYIRWFRAAWSAATNGLPLSRAQLEELDALLADKLRWVEAQPAATTPDLWPITEVVFRNALPVKNDDLWRRLRAMPADEDSAEDFPDFGDLLRGIGE